MTLKDGSGTNPKTLCILNIFQILLLMIRVMYSINKNSHTHFQGLLCVILIFWYRLISQTKELEQVLNLQEKNPWTVVGVCVHWVCITTEGGMSLVVNGGSGQWPPGMKGSCEYLE